MSTQSKKPTKSSSLAEFATARGAKRFEGEKPSNGAMWDLPKEILAEILENPDIYPTTIVDYIRAKAAEYAEVGHDTSGREWRMSVDAVKQWRYRWADDPATHAYVYGDDA